MNRRLEARASVISDTPEPESKAIRPFLIRGPFSTTANALGRSPAFGAPSGTKCGFDVVGYFEAATSAVVLLCSVLSRCKEVWCFLLQVRHMKEDWHWLQE